MNPMFLTVCLLIAVNLVRGDNIQLLSSASSAFSQRLYHRLAVSTPNAVYSPYSIHSAVAMTSLGARGETATEISQTLGLTTLPGNSAHQAYHDLIVQLNSAKNVKLNTGNAIFVNPNYPIETQFINDVRTNYFAETSNFDLAAVGGPEQQINDFVEIKTEGLIKNLLPKGSIDGLTVTVLVNTVFFNGTWESQFHDYRTQKHGFQKPDGSTSQVDMMNDDKFVNIKRNVDGVDVAELPFRGGRFSLVIALPRKTNGLTAFENSLTTPGKVDQLFEGLTPTRVRLSIPKFKIESKFTLNTVLQQLGIVKAFDPRTANFQGISNAASLHISSVVHQALIEVKETGTVAAAATAISVGITSVQQPPAESFIADHPFVFFLRDKQTNHILFQGKFSG